MTRKMRRKPSYCQRLIISRPLAVSGPMNSTDMPNISGRRVDSEPRQATPNMAAGTDPSSSTSLILGTLLGAVVFLAALTVPAGRATLTKQALGNGTPDWVSPDEPAWMKG